MATRRKSKTRAAETPTAVPARRYKVRRMATVEIVPEKGEKYGRVVNQSNVHEFDEATLAPLIAKGMIVDLQTQPEEE